LPKLRRRGRTRADWAMMSVLVMPPDIRQWSSLSATVRRHRRGMARIN
jgi:hypothetical protein